ncbi:MAG TPA: hypothetical protein VKR61_19030, partial [Bryobacteraceae bacterium]|nr:hypothetical protein [Bryobacteraceae bacterium]
VTAAALLIASPWILRAFLITGNPVAPLFNRLFPNPYFHFSTERELAAALGSFAGFPPWRVVYEVIVGGGFNGALGPVFFALPLGLLALRRPSGRLCCLAAALLALPWFWNTGARFLMPSLPFLALALVMPLPRLALWACMALQAVTCWPQVIGLYHPAYTWRLQRIPLRAALRLQPEIDYLAGTINEYREARLIEEHTLPGERVFALIPVARAYTTREVLEYWHSAQADNLTAALRAALKPDAPLSGVKAEWTPQPLSGLRIRIPEASPVEWRVHDVLVFSGPRRLRPDPPWELHAWPNEWESPLAFDNNRATCWRTWEPVRPGMYVEADFGRPQLVSGVLMTSPGAPSHVFEFYGRQGGPWHLLTRRPTIADQPLGDVRLSATRAVLAAGYRYILAYDGRGGHDALGSALAGHAADWGLEPTAQLGATVLFRIK